MFLENPGGPLNGSAPLNPVSRFWIPALARLGVGRLWVIIWLAALAVPFCPVPWLALLTVAAWLSVAALAPGRHQAGRLIAAAFIFMFFWSLLTGLFYFLHSTSMRPVLNLAAWLALGLNLMLAKTPLELALTTGRFLQPFLGRLNSQKLALALALLARLIPGLLASALKIRGTVNYRAAHLPWTRRLLLMGRTLIRDTLAQSDDLSRSLLKRWPW